MLHMNINTVICINNFIPKCRTGYTSLIDLTCITLCCQEMKLIPTKFGMVLLHSAVLTETTTDFRFSGQKVQKVQRNKSYSSLSFRQMWPNPLSVSCPKQTLLPQSYPSLRQIWPSHMPVFPALNIPSEKLHHSEINVIRLCACS